MRDPALQPILAVIGHPVAGDPTQFIMERALAAAGLDWRFLSLDVAPERLAEAVHGAAALGFAGLAIGAPHQAATADLLDSRAPSVAAAGATDCLISQDGGWHGENVLGAVVLSSIAERTAAAAGDAPVTVHGTGVDAARIAALLALSGYPTRVAGTPELAAELADRLSQATERPVARADSAATPVLVLAGDLEAGRLPWETPPELLVDCGAPGGEELADRIAAEGAQVVPCLDVATERARAAFHHWTASDADPDAVREAIEEYWAV